jgi:hypothetical protein|tara:strand:+ start:1343 stop:2245 length:903 start_codon:yes stop_codon:yes gene_type:complete
MSEETLNTNESSEEQVVEIEEVVDAPEDAVVDESQVEQNQDEVVDAELVESSENDEELEGYSDKVQKRINSLTRRLREAERASDSAYNMANDLKKENDRLKKYAVDTNQNLYNAKEGEISSQRTQATIALKSALETGDHDKAAKAQDILARLAVEENNVKQNQQYFSQSQFLQPNEQIQQPQIQQPSEKAQAWADEREWFGKDTVMTAATFAIHQDLANEGFDLESDEYYTEVDARLKKSFPQAFEKPVETKKPQQRVASADRNTESTTGKKKIKLSPSEVQMAKKLNVPLNEYAKYVKR